LDLSFILGSASAWRLASIETTNFGVLVGMLLRSPDELIKNAATNFLDLKTYFPSTFQKGSCDTVKVCWIKESEAGELNSIVRRSLD
jgi:hypothetical protein